MKKFIIALVGLFLTASLYAQHEKKQVEFQEMSKFIALCNDFKKASNNFTNSAIQPSNDLIEGFKLLAPKYGGAENFLARLNIFDPGDCYTRCWAQYFKCIEGCPGSCTECDLARIGCLIGCQAIQAVKTQKEN